MTRKRLWRKTIGAFLFCACLSTPSAYAQGEDEYARVIDEAIAEFDARRFAEARSRFVRAHEIAPSARTLRGIGLASFEMGDYVEAYRALGLALSESNRPLTEAQRAAAMALVERARGFVGIFRVLLSPEDAHWTLDGRAAELSSDGRLLVARGTHEIVATAPRRLDARVSFEVLGGEEDDLSIELSPMRPDPIENARGARLEPPAPTYQWDPAPAIVLMAGGGAAAVASVVTGLAWWLHQERQWRRCLQAGDRCTNGSEVRSSGENATGTTIGLALAGAAALGAGVVLFLLDRGGVRDRAWRCEPDGPLIGCAFSF